MSIIPFTVTMLTTVVLMLLMPSTAFGITRENIMLNVCFMYGIGVKYRLPIYSLVGAIQ